MRDVSQRFKNALGTAQRRVTKIIAVPPDQDPIELDFISGSVTADISRSARYQASLELSPKLGQNLFDQIAAPGTIIDIDHGINFGGAATEWVDVFHGEITSGSTSVLDGNINVSLSDLWTRVDRCRFLSPYTPATGGTRGLRVAEVLSAAFDGGLVVNLDASGGTLETESVWDKSRTDFVESMEKEGSLDVFFEPNGQLRIRPKPTLNPTSSVWSYQTGISSNIKTFERTRPFDRLYNTVVVIPATDDQFWDAEYAVISDPDHPRHPSKVGIVPYFYASPTIETKEVAQRVAQDRLQDILGITETVSLSGLSNPALEVGDVITIAHQGSYGTSAFNAAHIIDSWSLDLITGDMSLNTRSSSTTDIEEGSEEI